jgi:hypothetical protein
MSETTKFLTNTIKMVGTLLWIGVLYHYGVIELIADYVSAVITFNIDYLCCK